MAGHNEPRTTTLYDRWKKKLRGPSSSGFRFESAKTRSRNIFCWQTNELAKPYWRFDRMFPPVSLITTDILMFAAKRLPFGVGTTIEFLDSVRQSYQNFQQDVRLNAIDGGGSVIDTTVRNVLTGMGKGLITGDELNGYVTTLSQLRSNGYEPTLFEGLLQNSTYWPALKKHPDNYGRVLPHTELVDSNHMKLIIHLDSARVLEITPFALSQLLVNQKVGIPKAKVLSARDVWALKTSNSANVVPFAKKRKPLSTPSLGCRPRTDGFYMSARWYDTTECIRFFSDGTASCKHWTSASHQMVINYFQNSKSITRDPIVIAGSFIEFINHRAGLLMRCSFGTDGQLISYFPAKCYQEDEAKFMAYDFIHVKGWSKWLW
jgi:hypothetical protein